jgi:hypothetical protein
MRPGRKNGIKPDGWKIELELGNKQDLLEIGKAKREANLLIGKYKKEPDLSFNNKSEQPHNTRAIIAESLGMSTGKAKHPLEMLRFQNVTVT